MKSNILHISAHLGGGIGSVLLNYLNETKSDPLYQHHILCLDSVNETAQRKLQTSEIIYKELMFKRQEDIKTEISKADIVIIHWWNHPLLYEFIVKNKLPASRVVFWSHVSGFDVPQVFSNALFDYVDYFIFSTPISYLTKTFKEYLGDKQKFDDIWSTGGLQHVHNIQKKEHDEFIVGYIGTLDYAKIYPNFIDLCSKINIKNVKFIICGDGDFTEFEKKIKEKDIQDKFLFTGFVKDIRPYLEIFDVFGYPLNKNHYGTCDQALAEAMGSSTVPIVFDNAMENNMVEDMNTGLIVSYEDSYVNAILKLYNDKTLRVKLATNAKKEALKKFSIDSTIQKWNCLFDKALKKQKTEKIWSGKYYGINTSPYEIFLESIGDSSKIFDNNDTKEIKRFLSATKAWDSKTKGSIHHYLNFFEDEKLKQWSML